MSAVDKIKNWNLHFNQPDGGQVVLPPDITDVTSEQLGELLTKLTSWTNYIASQLAMAQLEERSALKKLEFLENTLLVKRMGAQTKGERVTTVKAEIATHQDIVDLSNDYEEKYAYRKLVEMLMTNHERDVFVVSREMSRRSTENKRNF